MRSVIRIIMVSCIYQIFFCAALAGENNSAKDFYQDLAGYHALGKYTGENSEEAVRLAKSEAIKKVFTEIGKDGFFQQLFISTMPQFIIIEESQTEKAGNKFVATVKVLIDQNAIIMLEDPYSRNVAELLNKTDKTIEEIEKNLADAENSELNLRMSEALFFFRSAKIRCSEITDLLKNITDSSIRSEKGNNILILQKLSTTLLTRANAGYKRLEEIEAAAEKDSKLDELAKTFDLLAAEIRNVEIVIDENSDVQPFYDMPKSKLEMIKIDIRNALDKSKTVNKKLGVLSDQIPETRLLLKEKIASSIDELKRMEKKLTKMKSDVELEINDPRLARQQRAQNWDAFWKSTGLSFEYIFFHKPDDILALRYYLPFEWPVDQFLQFAQNYNFYIRLEKTFVSGFWIKTQFTHTDTYLVNDNFNTTSNQELAIGYFQRYFLLGGSFTWDWERKIGTQPVAKDTSLKIYLGGVNSSLSRADWLLSFSYKFPKFVNPFFYAYQLNLDADFLARIEDILLMEAGLSFNTLQLSPADASGLRLENLQYSFDWKIGFGLRFPKPFVWGICFNYNSTAPITSTGTSSGFGAFQERKYWSAYVEYAF